MSGKSWAGTYEQTMTELQEMGLSATSARGALQLAQIGGIVDLGCGQELRRALLAEGYEITGTYRPEPLSERRAITESRNG